MEQITDYDKLKDILKTFQGKLGPCIWDDYIFTQFTMTHDHKQNTLILDWGMHEYNGKRYEYRYPMFNKEIIGDFSLWTRPITEKEDYTQSPRTDFKKTNPFEIWEDIEEREFTLCYFNDRNNSFISKNAVLIHSFIEDDINLAKKKAHELLLWEPYIPMD